MMEKQNSGSCSAKANRRSLIGQTFDQRPNIAAPEWHLWVKCPRCHRWHLVRYVPKSDVGHDSHIVIDCPNCRAYGCQEKGCAEHWRRRRRPQPKPTARESLVVSWMGADREGKLGYF